MIANLAPGGGVQADSFLGIQKAAVLLIMLGDVASAELVKQLTEDEVQLVAREIARQKKVLPAQAESVLEEFYQLTAARDYVNKGGVDYAIDSQESRRVEIKLGMP